MKRRAGNSAPFFYGLSRTLDTRRRTPTAKATQTEKNQLQECRKAE
ncbi:hypothetical protein ADG881_129 [Alcanivorax sp. DG881]|jgi:hypothetical protein|nr:hypothetical protein ADG881_129 [Alcanivorax sp. DG881]